MTPFDSILTPTQAQSFNLMEARIVIEQWRRHYNTVRPHSALG